ncbi:hypothetical protein [Pseudonocardia sp. H11422]|uniref:hypothetical protein n=1 Tax=Pseudonocardia sp. H11422 TaxID=2835866 RepID=UPI001BDD37B3|nr:hypothetical protein [Pseudonocardia sp. H11422]
MSWTPVDPPWAVPTRVQISDLHWLAYAEASETDSPRAAGVVAALAWVRGGQDAPVTARPEQPVTSALAQYEMWAASASANPDAPPPLRTLSEELGVAYRRPLRIPADEADGVRITLSWLLGRTRRPPMPLPERRPDGQLVAVQELVESAMAAAPHKIWGPEERHAARAEARAAVERSRRLIDKIAAVQERLRTG